METKKKIPKVRIGEVWLPAHKIWDVVESINTATDLVERYNETRPEQTTPITEEVVAKVRARIRDMEMRTGGEGALKAAAEAAAAAAAADLDAAKTYKGSNTVIPADGAADQGSNELAAGEQDKQKHADYIADAAKQLLEAMPLEDVLRMLQEDYGESIAIHELIAMVGEDTYREALIREAKEFAANMITPDQIAILWNESGIARPTGGLWTEKDIHELTG
jgi:hypothetical protein